MFIANRYPDKHAGVIMQIHSGNGTTCPKHISVAFIAGDADKTHPISATKALAQGCTRIARATLGIRSPEHPCNPDGVADG